MTNTRRAVVSYRVDASNAEKRNALLEGIRVCATELVELGCNREAAQELDQVGNDLEQGELT